MDAEWQRKQIASVERRDATLARREGEGNLHNAKLNRVRGNYILANQQLQEFKWDIWWANRRTRIANKNSK